VPIFFVVDHPKDWPIAIPGVEVVTAREYLTRPENLPKRGVKVFNLCRSYRYQSVGYYVSLLAAARDHRPLPSVATSQDFRSPSLVRVMSEDLVELIAKSLSGIVSDEFVLSIYFGRNLAKKYRRVSRELFNLFPAPLLRAWFLRDKDGWELRRLRPIGVKDIPDGHREFVIEAAKTFFERRVSTSRRRAPARFDLAILVNPAEEEPPSNKQALARFVKAAQEVGFRPEFIESDDYGRLTEFDALFIRETTSVNHHTYRFSRRAAAEGLVAIDDPDSILRSTNKVFLAEALKQAGVPVPKTRIVHRDNIDEVAAELGSPAILKLPDSSFSMGVVRCNDIDEFRQRAAKYLEQSDLLIAQEFLPTEFDWRVGVFDGRALYVCRYFMAKSHWQIIQRDTNGKFLRGGKVEVMRAEDAPERVIDIALRSTRPIGDGLYGVDLKEVNGRCHVIEVNDNPSIDGGFEDRVIGLDLYRRIMNVFLERVERLKAGGSRK